MNILEYLMDHCFYRITTILEKNDEGKYLHMIKGILFDMDGVLLDSEQFIRDAAIAFFAENGIQAEPEDFLPYVGAGENKYIGCVAEDYGLKIDIEKAKKRTYELYDELSRGHMPPMEGVLEFVGWCREQGLKLAVATSADETKMLINLREIGLPAESFDFLINGLQIEHKKPAPDIYLAAAEGLGLQPAECIVIEDAVNGCQAAKAAGAYCIAVTSSFSRKQLIEAGADRVVDTLKELAGDPDLLKAEPRKYQ